MEESDKELLELAAKAAGLTELTQWSEEITSYDSDHYGYPALHEPDGQCYSWNPLINDGDALRLAVKLRISVDRAELGRTTAWNHMHNVKSVVYDNDELMATRIAIVRAAAEIGKQKD